MGNAATGTLKRHKLTENETGSTWWTSLSALPRITLTAYGMLYGGDFVLPKIAADQRSDRIKSAAKAILTTKVALQYRAFPSIPPHRAC
jgi:hypothetical protein